jgi:hypothetical protein
MIKKLKLRHLNKMDKGGMDTHELIENLSGHKNSWLNRKIFYKKLYKEAFATMLFFSKLDFLKVELNPNNLIKLPNSIDEISFAAMMKIQVAKSNLGTKTTSELICEIIALACYKANTPYDFDTDSRHYKSFKNRVWNSSALDMVGLFNWVSEALDTSTKTWNERFFSVQVDDKDYEQAGGNRMDQFNVITTIKHLCTDFNVTEDQAWQLSYVLSQTNSYAKATYGHIQNEMTKIKERKMKQQRS